LRGCTDRLATRRAAGVESDADAVVEGAADLVQPDQLLIGTDGVSAVLLGVQQCEGVADALFEELVGELSVGQARERRTKTLMVYVFAEARLAL
jgi:hypothetical protein